LNGIGSKGRRKGEFDVGALSLAEFGASPDFLTSRGFSHRATTSVRAARRLPLASGCRVAMIERYGGYLGLAGVVLMVIGWVAGPASWLALLVKTMRPR
jgi:hypothetical protein